MRRLPFDEAAQRHDGVIAAGVAQERDGGGQLERAGDLEALDLGAGPPRDLRRSGGEPLGDLGVPAGDDQRDAGAARGLRACLRCRLAALRSRGRRYF